MFEFLEEERSEGRCVRNCDLREKALEVAASLNLPNFKASPQWMAIRKRRWNVGRPRGTNTSQRVKSSYYTSALPPLPGKQWDGFEFCLEHGSDHVQVLSYVH